MNKREHEKPTNIVSIDGNIILDRILALKKKIRVTT
jgi:hypothetical protein